MLFARWRHKISTSLHQ